MELQTEEINSERNGEGVANYMANTKVANYGKEKEHIK